MKPSRWWIALLASCACNPGPQVDVYVTSGFTDHVYRLYGQTGLVLDSFPLNPRLHETDEPHGIAMAPDGSHWYASVAHGEPTLWKFERPSNRRVGMVRLETAGAARVGITPDGTRAFVPDYYRDGAGAVSQVAVVELDDLTVIARLDVCPAPHDAQTSPSGELVAITCSMSDELVLLDAVWLGEVSRFHVDENPGDAGAPRFKPLNAVWAADGSAVFATMHQAAEVRKFSSEGIVVGLVHVGAGPAQIAMSPDGSTLVVANRLDGSVSIVDATRLEERARIDIGESFPHGVALTADGRNAFVTYEGTTTTPGGVVSIDVAEGDIRWKHSVGGMTFGVTVAPR